MHQLAQLFGVSGGGQALGLHAETAALSMPGRCACSGSSCAEHMAWLGHSGSDSTGAATTTATQVWHAVLGYISGFEEQVWEAEDDPAAAERMRAAVAAYKGARAGRL